MMFVLLLAFLVQVNGEDCKFASYISLSGGAYEIRNPGHPDMYGPSSNCSWSFSTDKDKRLSLDCPTVDLSHGVSWDRLDKLSVAGSMHNDNEVFFEPFNVQSSSHGMTLVFTSRDQSKGGRFVCSVRTVEREPCDCGWSSKMKSTQDLETKNDFPSVVSIIQDGRHICGGSIISPNFVLTAAHCLYYLKFNSTRMLVGEYDISKVNETNAVMYRPSMFLIHPEYKIGDRRMWNDIGLIKSSTPFKFNDFVGPICLPFNRPFLPAVGENLTALGWGIVSYGGPTSDLLMKISVQVAPESRCKAVFNESATSGKQVCTVGTNSKDICQGHGGGPLIIPELRTNRFFLAASVSFGYGVCDGSYPSVNTRITSYLDWIQEQTGDKFCIK